MALIGELFTVSSISQKASGGRGVSFKPLGETLNLGSPAQPEFDDEMAKERGSGPRSFLPDFTLMLADCPVPSPCQADMHSNDPNWYHYTNNLISIIQVWAAD